MRQGHKGANVRSHSVVLYCTRHMSVTAEPHIPMSRGRKNQVTTAPNKKAEGLAPQQKEAAQQLAPTPQQKEPVVEFVWPWGGDKVEVAGSFNNWQPVPMTYDQITRTHRVWIPSLPRGRVSYKFIIDGQWRYDGNKPIVSDDFGNCNNMMEL